ncbi:MAG: AAA family ATPase [Candidatus Melainabacteria bacterium]|nr:AAA family ATPase [Candidatus Melainabacteria bacterium]
MQISELEIQGYRSIRELRIPLSPVTVLVGANGCGKSNIYQALRLLAAAPAGTLASSIAGEGGMASIIWAGQRRKNEEKRILLKARFEDYDYCLEFGFIPLSDRPQSGGGPGLEVFRGDPDVKSETVSYLSGKRPVPVLERRRGSIRARNIDGRMVEYPLAVAHCQSVLAELREPHKFPELSVLGSVMSSWRFYHKFRTDSLSPIREPQVGTLTQVLSHDGGDLVSALATILATGDKDGLEESVKTAFPGAKLIIDSGDSELTFCMETPGLRRPLEARELSDGTLQYLCLLAALLSPRAAPLVVLNEPETSIHPDLIEPLAELISHASNDSQVIVTTHNRDLAAVLRKRCDVQPVQLEKLDGATRIKGQKLDSDLDSVAVPEIELTQRKRRPFRPGGSQVD